MVWIRNKIIKIISINIDRWERPQKSSPELTPKGRSSEHEIIQMDYNQIIVLKRLFITSTIISQIHSKGIFVLNWQKDRQKVTTSECTIQLFLSWKEHKICFSMMFGIFGLNRFRLLSFGQQRIVLIPVGVLLLKS